MRPERASSRPYKALLSQAIHPGMPPPALTGMPIRTSSNSQVTRSTRDPQALTRPDMGRGIQATCRRT
ncbi:hypothetical protein Naga_101362g1 [Nannochloropsis gaditana]|uniref:Uncharacterized protein n=1 Tax=Nannochloropsis gaditana TaxID=72520 RepID=W7SZY1_9STRA|nr:hypothetical protein Naga_101362g1 [Nannochloropsis gaditana]